MRIHVGLLVLALAGGGCATGGAVPRPFPGASLPPGGGGTPDPGETFPTETDSAGALVRTALQYLGTPYRNGGSDPAGFDCSGFVQYVFAEHGTRLPREVKDQYRTGDRVDLQDIQPGDLVFFETVADGASHVGMAIGSGRFVHAPSSRGVVRVEPYTASYWARRFVGARRIGTSDGAVGATGAPSSPGAVHNVRVEPQ